MSHDVWKEVNDVRIDSSGHLHLLKKSFILNGGSFLMDFISFSYFEILDVD